MGDFLYVKIENVAIEKTQQDLQMQDAQSVIKNQNLEGKEKGKFMYVQEKTVTLEKKKVSLRKDLINPLRLIKKKLII